jgi:hypothetical protein
MQKPIDNDYNIKTKVMNLDTSEVISGWSKQIKGNQTCMKDVVPYLTDH